MSQKFFNRWSAAEQEGIMSILFGILKQHDGIVLDQQLREFGSTTSRYAPEGTIAIAAGCVGMGFQPYSTTSRSALEQQPRRDHAGNLLTFDGRLDNHETLRETLHVEDAAATDSELVLAAYRQWNDECFRCFVGDWALALWDARSKRLYLARDHAGTRTLYFQKRKDSLVWATYVDTFFAGNAEQTVDETYVAAYLAGAPRQDRTPYANIRAVPPAHVLIASERSLTLKRHWSWIANDRIRYKNSGDYDAHFLHLFGQSVARRAAQGEPILAQLSGGMDSTSIVCMSDHLRWQADPHSTLLDTVSYYDDTEPSWNEKPYFTITEAHRGQTGLHVNVSIPRRSFQPAASASGEVFYRWPGFDKESWEHEQRLYEQLQSYGYRVLLSGIGGDELLGGVPTPIPELSDTLAAGDLVGLFRKATRWCVKTHTPVFHMLADVFRSTCALYLPMHSDRVPPPSWMSPRLNRLLEELPSYTPDSERLFGLCPSAIFAGRAWLSVLESLPSHNPEFFSRYEYRYPYLDRDLVDFLLRVPREQLVQPGRRRAMMRRALAGIVPEEILERKRKGFIARQPLAVLQNSPAAIRALFADPLVAVNGWIDLKELQRSVERITSGQDTDSWPAFQRLAAMEIFLRSIAACAPQASLEQHEPADGVRAEFHLLRNDTASVEDAQ
jgi:asparagine synthase (glutamine-hydrolysing)